MINIKAGVSTDGLKIQIKRIIVCIGQTFEKYGYEACITSSTEGKHMEGSLHYKGLAVDFRTNHIPSDSIMRQIEWEVREVLKRKDKRYQILLEKTHMHIEYDRRVK